MKRRSFLALTAPALLGGAAMTHKERVDKALRGESLDRPPFTFWHHFGLKDAEAHAAATLAFHRDYRTDIVKVMSDFPYPKPGGDWWQLKVNDNPFPQQIRALELIRDGLKGDAYFVETIFNSWTVAEKLSSPQEVLRLKAENPQALLDALEAITASQVKHVKKALAIGASGAFLAVANAQEGMLSSDDYRKFSAPFDRRILAAAGGAKLTTLHIHGATTRMELFRDLPAPVINYPVQTTGVPVSDMRKLFSAVLATGIDDVKYRTLTSAQITQQWQTAQSQAGNKFILAPGCSVPNESTPEELRRLPDLLHA
jgi:uroporphyrinogen decarboxylase